MLEKRGEGGDIKLHSYSVTARKEENETAEGRIMDKRQGVAGGQALSARPISFKLKDQQFPAFPHLLPSFLPSVRYFISAQGMKSFRVLSLG